MSIVRPLLTKKPHAHAEINWAHPMARGLVSLVLCESANPVDLVTREKWTTATGTPVYVDTPEGKGISTTSATTEVISPKTFDFSDNLVTAMVGLHITNNSFYKTYVALDSVDYQSGMFLQIRGEEGRYNFFVETNSFELGPSIPGGVHWCAWGTDPDGDNYGASMDGGLYTSTGNDATLAMPSSATPQLLGVDNLSSRSPQTTTGKIFVFALWKRGMSQAQRIWLSKPGAIWQLLQNPAYSFFPPEQVAAGGFGYRPLLTLGVGA